MADSRRYAVLFDLDGTLVDSIALLLASMRHTFQGRNRQPSDAEWIEGIGTPLPKQLTPYVESDEDRERLVNRYRTVQCENHDRLMARYEGVIDTLALLYQRGHPMAVVTSKGNAMMERGLKFIGADDYIEVFFSSRRRHTSYIGDWSSDVCCSDLSGRPVVDRVDRDRDRLLEAGQRRVAGRRRGRAADRVAGVGDRELEAVGAVVVGVRAVAERLQIGRASGREGVWMWVVRGSGRD